MQGDPRGQPGLKPKPLDSHSLNHLNGMLSAKQKEVLSRELPKNSEKLVKGCFRCATWTGSA